MAQAIASATQLPAGNQKYSNGGANITVPAGTQAQSVPAPGQRPQTFETLAQIVARAEWNAVSPRLAQPQVVIPAATSFILSGAITNLKPGDPLLIVPSNGTPALHVVQKITLAPDSKTTQVEVDGAGGGSGYNPSSEQPPGGNNTGIGSIDEITSVTLDSAAVEAIVNNTWDADLLVVLANTKNWPLDQLEAAINQYATTQNTASGAVHVFRQHAACFGYSLPLLEVPPFSPPPTVDPVGSHTLGDWNSSGTGSVYLDAPYPQIVPQSWAVLQANVVAHSPVAADRQSQ